MAAAELLCGGVDQVVLPGTRLAKADDYAAGEGTYVRHDRVCASLRGTVVIHTPEPSEDEDAAKVKAVLRVVRGGAVPSLMPSVGSTVTCKVTSINTQQARVVILCVDGKPVATRFSGIIRIQDIRALEKDKVEMHSSFRPNDVVLARVISLGDARSYYLSTAEDALGVIAARSEAGAPLIPTSWCEMTCQQSGLKELRKVAKTV
ncbi:uncharacterized protein MONBRDRAFT_29746 [Monosiga brevicollis MX1]|uniref:S1 motif domain-containing protein n=1 Tax=Monosiga brevicollis TaxID=81824 RepID=A9VC03_MONBE|nr:uncharacterized protein MONBRDRAFT_29746 [Monosiga brevicollis MX1]EDQ84894.1 predicted protein [Monosiga brevicollis MX1]|eukprot:XP_001750235.1 hypothetical protein [Monosiga brevicollis MX1]